jgi:MFS family permease
MVKTLGYSTIIMLFYMPGSFLGAIFSDIIGPKWCIVVGTSIQAVIGLLLGLFYEKLSQNIAAFVVVYGLFLTFGEFGLGDNLGLISAKSSATCVRGRFYGIAAATGKTGAFVGTYVFPTVLDLLIVLIQIIKAFGGEDTIMGKAGPCYVACGLAVLAASISWLCLPKLDQDCLQKEDQRFRRILIEHGYETDQMGMKARHESYEIDNGNFQLRTMGNY